jgi:hypothetical protein
MSFKKYLCDICFSLTKALTECKSPAAQLKFDLSPKPSILPVISVISPICLANDRSHDHVASTISATKSLVTASLHLHLSNVTDTLIQSIHFYTFSDSNKSLEGGCAPLCQPRARPLTVYWPESASQLRYAFPTPLSPTHYRGRQGGSAVNHKTSQMYQIVQSRFRKPATVLHYMSSFLTLSGSA